MESRSEKNKVVSGVIWKTAERFFSQGVSFIISIILARLLLPEDYGIVAMVLVFISIADVFVNSGLTTALIQKKDADETDFSTVFYCSLIISIVLYAVLFFCAPLIAKFYDDSSMIALIRVFALRVPMSVCYSVQNAYVSRHMLFRRLFLSTLGGALGSGVVGIVLAYFGFGVWALVSQYMVNTIVNTIVLFITVPWRPRLLFSWEAARNLTNYGWKILAANLSGTFFGQLRSLLVGKFYSSADLAYYNRGQQFPYLLYSNIGAAIMAVLFPALSNVVEDKVTFKNYIRKAERTIIFILVPMLFGLFAVAEPLVLLLLGEEWTGSIPFLQILCMCSVVDTCGIAQFEALKASGRSESVLKLEVVKKPIYVILLVLGLKISVKAMAITMLIYNTYGLAMNSRELIKHIGYTTKEQIEDIVPAIVLSFFMAFVVSIVKIPVKSLGVMLLIKIVIGIIVYIVLAAVFKMKAFVLLIGMAKEKMHKHLAC